MRKLALVLFLALPLFAYEVRSSHHALAIAIEGSGDSVIYVVQVTDVKSGAILLSDRFDRAGEDTFEAKGRTMRVKIQERYGRLTAEIDVVQDDMLVDALRASWLIAPLAVRKPGDAPLRVGGDVKAPVLVKRVEPEYTAEAKESRISGIVILEIVVSAEGNVIDAKVLKPLPFGLDEKAVEAVKQWKFRPGTLNEMPVAVIYNITMNFKLDE